MQFYWLINEVWRLAFSTDSSKRRIIFCIYFTSFSVVKSLCSKNFLTISSACLSVRTEIIVSSSSFESSSTCCRRTPSAIKNSSNISSSGEAFISPTFISSTVHLVDNLFADSSFCRQYVSPTVHFADSSFRRQCVLPTVRFTDSHFADSTFHRQSFHRQCMSS